MMSLGDRIKRYEAVTSQRALPRVPLMIRVDGRAFHTFTRGMERPYDQHLIDSMVNAAYDVASEMQGFKAAYIQSDEVTFCLTDYDTITSQGWFDYKLPKVISASASLMTAYFNKHINTDKLATFDSRAFSVPAHDVPNAFLWRVKDWARNSLQMFSRAHFSHKELHGKNTKDMHDMLHGIGKNWTTDVALQHRNGTFLISDDNLGIVERFDILPTYQSVNNAIGHLFAPRD